MVLSNAAAKCCDQWSINDGESATGSCYTWLYFIVPTNGWLERLIIRYNITFMKIGGERAAADRTGADN